MDQNRGRILTEIDNYLAAINENEKRIDTIKMKLKDESLKDEEKNELLSELEVLEDENSEHSKDIAMLEEVLYKMDVEEQDERACSPYEERYDSWEEVFTGGDY